MDIPEIEEAAYGFILRSIFSYLKKVFSIDIDNSKVIKALSGCTTTSLITLLDTELLVNQIVRVGLDEAVITAVTSDVTLNTTTITISPALSVAPVLNTDITVLLTVVDYDLQYAIFQHAKFIYEGQKKQTSIIDSVTDANGNKASYKVVPPVSVISAYREYSDNPPAF